MRGFIAVPLPQSTRDEIEAKLASLRGKLPFASWTRPDTWHLTLAFLGEQHESLIEPLTAALQRETAGLERFEISFTGAGFFPSIRRPRVLWIGVEPHEPLMALAAAVRKALRSAEISFDEKEFAPHLTIARLREPWPPRSIDQLLKPMSSFRTAPAPVDRVTLYRSHLSSKGAEHEAVSVVRLGD
jgi:RNA 2',3'-cyclic 3'-phosphodiesterase